MLSFDFVDASDDRSRLSDELKRAFARAVTPPPRDYPIGFSAELLDAILAGRKTETRRPMRPQPLDDALGEPPVATGDRLAIRESWCRDPAGGFAYQRDGGRPAGVARWTPSRFMPRDAARLFLAVKGVDAARLSAIDEAAAIAEGFARSPLGNLSARDAFLATWDTFYGDSPFAVANDPWVWVLRFAR